jgi:hypothetical protein
VTARQPQPQPGPPPGRDPSDASSALRRPRLRRPQSRRRQDQTRSDPRVERQISNAVYRQLVIDARH